MMFGDAMLPMVFNDSGENSDDNNNDTGRRHNDKGVIRVSGVMTNDD